MRRVHLPLDSLPIGCTFSAYGMSAGASTISLQIAPGKSKADGL